MIRLAILLLSIIATLAVVLVGRHARAMRLRRLVCVTVAAPPEVRLEDRPILRVLERLLPQALIRNLRLLDIDPMSREASAMGAGIVLGCACAGVLAGPVAAMMMALSVLIVGIAALHILAGRRIRELGALLPGFFDRVRQLLVIGNSLPTAFGRAVQGGQPRLVAFFAPAQRRLANGAGFAETIRQSAEDVTLYEMHLFSAAVSTNMRFGGSLTHALNNLTAFLRKRASIERELRASTALIRSSAWVLGCLPMLVAALIVAQNQDYARWFVVDPTGKILFAYCIVSQAMGVVVMRSIIRTEF